jgi:hypothetical protein
MASPQNKLKEDKLFTTTNFLVTKQPTWLTNLRRFSSVKNRQNWVKINWRFHKSI